MTDAFDALVSGLEYPMYVVTAASTVVVHFLGISDTELPSLFKAHWR